MSILFANANQGGRSASGNLFEFKAGISRLEPIGSSASSKVRKVVSDPAKGLVYIKQSGDQLLHFYWKNRETNSVDVDLIVFPGDTEFFKVKEAPEGHVFMLKFKSASSDRKLFWLQDPSKDTDELVKKVNEVLNNPPALRTSARGGASERNAFGNLGGDEISALKTMDQNQLMQLFSMIQSNGSSSGADLITGTTPKSRPKEAAIDDVSSGADPVPGQLPVDIAGNVTDAPGPSAARKGLIRPDQLHSILSSIADGKLPASGSGSGSTAGSSKPAKGNAGRSPVRLSDVLNQSKVGGVLQANADNLKPHLPAEEPIKQSESELKETLATPQFSQIANVFGDALQLGELGTVLQQFNLPSDAVSAAQTGDILEFAKKLTLAESKQPAQPDTASSSNKDEINAAINAEAEKEETTEAAVKEPSAKKGKPDEGMDLD